MSTRKENMTDKQCSRCKKEVPLDLFYVQGTYKKTKKPRYSSRCKPCTREYVAIYDYSPENYERRRLQWLKNAKENIKKPHYKIASKLRQAVYRIVKNIETTSDEVVMKWVGCDRLTFKKHLEKQFLPGMKWSNHGAWTTDHIEPLSKWKLTDPEVAKRANHYFNIRPEWVIQNKQKYNK